LAIYCRASCPGSVLLSPFAFPGFLPHAENNNKEPSRETNRIFNALIRDIDITGIIEFAAGVKSTKKRS
jgi:hypothetical protein